MRRLFLVVALIIGVAFVIAPSVRSGAAAQPGRLEVEAGGPYQGNVGQPIFFSATIRGGLPPGAVTVQWSFGDGGVAIGQNAEHAYSQPGNYTVTVSATAGSQSAVSSTTATVLGQAPPPPGQLGIEVGGPYQAAAGEPITFTATLRGGLPPGTVQVQWSFGDGAGGFGQIVQHAYAAPGTYTVTVTATAGSQSAVDSGLAVITGPITPPPGQLGVSAGGPYQGQVGVPIVVNATIRGGLPPGTVQISWQFGDGGTGSGQTAQYIYSQPGTYQITVTATAGGSVQPASATTTATIAGAPPPPPPPPAAMQPTAVNVIQPTATSGPDLATATNCSASSVLLRPGVYSCNTVDPCFSVPGVTGYVICNVDLATGIGRKMPLSQPLNPSVGTQNVQVSALRLDLENGATCTYLGGATFGFRDQRVNYSCDDGSYIAGQPQPGLIWTVTRGTQITTPMPTLDPNSITTVAVRVAWV